MKCCNQYITPAANYKSNSSGFAHIFGLMAHCIRWAHEAPAGSRQVQRIYLRAKRMPRVPGPQWQDTVQPAVVSKVSVK